jgi:hypothetical protein
MLSAMSGFRSTIVAIAILVLVPAWMTRVTYLYACPGDGEVKKTRCCAAKQAKAPTWPKAKRACCDISKVELGAPRTASAIQDVVAIAPPDSHGVVTTVPIVLSEAARRPSRSTGPRGPPTYLRNLTLLL